MSTSHNSTKKPSSSKPSSSSLKVTQLHRDHGPSSSSSSDVTKLKAEVAKLSETVLGLRAYLKKQEDEKKAAIKRHADEDKKNHTEYKKQQLKNVQADMKALKATFDKGKKNIEEHENMQKKLVKLEKEALAKIKFSVKTDKELVEERERLASYMSVKVKRMMLDMEIKRMIGRQYGLIYGYKNLKDAEKKLEGGGHSSKHVSTKGKGHK